MDRAMLFGLLLIGTVLALILDQVRTGGYYRTSVFDTVEQVASHVKTIVFALDKKHRAPTTKNQSRDLLTEPRVLGKPPRKAR
jgi:hypothetical protein